MSFSNKASRRYSNVLCGEAVKLIAKPTEPVSAAELTIAQQENMAWAQYRAELACIARTPVKEPEQPSCNDGNDVTDIDVSGSIADSIAIDGDEDRHISIGHGRFQITGLGAIHLYPTGKPGQTTTDRRYHPSVKKSDSKKIHGKLKGKSYSQLKKDCSSLTVEDIIIDDI